MKQITSIFVLALLCAGTLSACGIKPKNIDAPSGKESSYPRTYPDLKTDP